MIRTASNQNIFCPTFPRRSDPAITHSTPAPVPGVRPGLLRGVRSLSGSPGTYGGRALVNPSSELLGPDVRLAPGVLSKGADEPAALLQEIGGDRVVVAHVRAGGREVL